MKLRILPRVAVVFVAISLSSCADKTERLARKPEVCRALVSWVDATMGEELSEGNGLRLYGGPRPGRYVIERPFDPVAAGLGEGRWHATVICERAKEPIAVYFCDGGREGIVVRLGERWGVEGHGEITPVSERVAFHTTTD